MVKLVKKNANAGHQFFLFAPWALLVRRWVDASLETGPDAFGASNDWSRYCPISLRIDQSRSIP